MRYQKSAMPIHTSHHFGVPGQIGLHRPDGTNEVFQAPPPYSYAPLNVRGTFTTVVSVYFTPEPTYEAGPVPGSLW